MLNDKFTILSGVITVIGAASYAFETLKGRNQPNRITWAMWTVAPMIGFFAQLSQGVGLQSILTFSIGFGPLLVLIASFVDRKAYWRLTKFDFLCGCVSVVALVLWALTGKGLIALFLSIVADFFAAIPTIKKSYQDPASESALAFVLGAIGALITLLTIKDWSISNSVFGIYILVVDTLIAGLILMPNMKKKYSDSRTLH